MTWLHAFLWLNLVVSLGSTLAALIAVVRPNALSRSADVTPGERFYARMYAARSVPLGLIFGAIPLIYAGPTVTVFVNACTPSRSCPQLALIPAHAW